MDAVGIGLQALGGAVGSVAAAFAWVYVVGFACKTLLIFADRAKSDDLKDWFDLKWPFGRKKGGL